MCGITKGVDERIDEGVLRWSGRVERMENDTTAKRFYVGECAGNRSLGWPRKRWIDTLKECLKKRGWDIRSLVNTRSLELKCARMLHEAMQACASFIVW